MCTRKVSSGRRSTKAGINVVLVRTASWTGPSIKCVGEPNRSTNRALSPMARSPMRTTISPRFKPSQEVLKEPLWLYVLDHRGGRHTIHQWELSHHIDISEMRRDNDYSTPLVQDPVNMLPALNPHQRLDLVIAEPIQPDEVIVPLGEIDTQLAHNRLHPVRAGVWTEHMAHVVRKNAFRPGR